MERDITKDKLMNLISAGRTFEEEVAEIRREGVHGRPSIIRQFALQSRGLGGKAGRAAENVILFGCYTPFTGPQELEFFLTLLDRLGVEYTYLAKEYCCGLPLVELTRGAERERGIKEAKDYIGMNIAAARELGAKNMIYNCIWCVHMARKLFPHEDIAQLYRLDMLVNKLRKGNLQIKPTTVGYYEGCHVRTRSYASGIRLRWPAYREIMGAIKGLEIVDLPKFCCLWDRDRIVEEVGKRHLHIVVSPCNSCVVRLRGVIKIKSPQEVLLEAVS